MIEKTVTERLVVFLLTIALVVAPVSATGGLWQDLGDVGGIWQDLGNLGELWSDSGLGTVFGDTNLDTIPFSGIGASDQPAEWNQLKNKVIVRGSPDGTTIYSNIYAECSDPDGPEIISIVSTHSKFTLYFDGNDIKLRNLDPAHTGTHNIVLDCNNIQASFQLSIIDQPNQPPTANAGPDRTVDVNDVIIFDGSQSSDPDGTITTFAWNFGDGSTATGRIATHAFTSLGTFTVTLTVTDNNGATASDTATVIANGRPTAALVCPASGKIGETLLFDARQSSDDGQIANYHFDFGDGTTTSGINPFVTKTYASTGTFTVTLTVTDEDNLSHQASCSIQISAVANLPPVANAGLDRTVSINDMITFDGSGSTDADGTIVRYEWRFSDGVTLVGQVVQRVFSAVGAFIATLTVTDDDGASGTDTARTLADGMPTAVLNCPASAFPNKQVVFDASQSTDDTTILDYAIDFGDGTAAHSLSAFIVHAYAAIGTYNVLLTVTDDDNLPDTEACTVTVAASPPEEEEDELERLIFSRINFNEIARAGETLEISVTLFNDGPKELEDMRLTAFVYDLDMRAVQGPFELDNGDSETHLLLLNLPSDVEGKFDIEFTASNDDMHLNEYRTIVIK